jgi:hypothetical protein
MPAAGPAPPEPEAAPAPSDRLAALRRHATEIVAEFREAAKVRGEAKPAFLFESQLRSTLSRLCSDLKRVGYEIGVV